MFILKTQSLEVTNYGFCIVIVVNAVAAELGVDNT
jgi:hypothetical protein